MQTAILLSTVVLVALVAFGLLFPDKKRTASSFRRERRVGAAANPYHAVSIHPAANACGAAEDIKSQRFLSEEAPALPLPNCQANCHCRYVHHTDRRSGARDRRLRKAEQSEVVGFFDADNRRRNAGRRHTDIQFA